MEARSQELEPVDRFPGAGLTLFLCLFAGQAAVIAISPVLAEVASDFEIATATAGRLRSVSGLAAGVVALTMGALARRFGLRDLLLMGLFVLAAGSLLSAASPTFAVLVVAQVAVGAGLAVVLAGALAAAAAWSTDERRGQAGGRAARDRPGTEAKSPGLRSGERRTCRRNRDRPVMPIRAGTLSLDLRLRCG